MGYMIFDENEVKGPLAKNIGPERSEAVKAQLGMKAGDAAFFLAGTPEELIAELDRLGLGDVRVLTPEPGEIVQ